MMILFSFQLKKADYEDYGYFPISYRPKKDTSKELELLVSGYGDLFFSQGSLHKFNMKIYDVVKCRKLITKNKPSSGKVLDMSRKFCAVAEHGANHPRVSFVWRNPHIIV